MPSLMGRFQSWLGGLLGATKSVAAPAQSTRATANIEHEEVQNVVPYDENLLERSRTQWQFGDWAGLTQLNKETLQHHPDRAKLAAARQWQQSVSQTARQFTYVRTATA